MSIIIFENIAKFDYTFSKLQNMQIPLIASWQKILSSEMEKKYYLEILSFLDNEINARKMIYPSPENIFSAMNICPFESVKVVILGQDPYHGPGQSHGLSFSVPEGVKIPPSLKNIFKECYSILSMPTPSSGDLTHWAKQGVLLLNSILTVEASKPASHAKIGWEKFTDIIISKLSKDRSGIIFLLWGNFARSKKTLIDSTKHYILEAPHPSPFSAHTGFFGCGHFQKINEILREKGNEEIVW